MDYVLLSQLALHQQDCRVKVRISRIWESTAPYLKGDIFSLDCLLVDEKVFSMQATIRKQDAVEFKGRIAEGSVYLIEKFTVIPSRKKFVAIDRYYMIQINKSTQLTPIEEDIDAIPLYSFNFSTFFEIEKKRNNDVILTDVVGKITAITEITHRYIGQTPTPIRNLEIQDLDNNVLGVTLWDKFAVEFDESDISGNRANSSIIIVLAGMTVRTFKEKVHLSTCSASKIYFNLQIPEVSELLNRLHKESNPIQRITYGDQKPISPEEEMCVNRKTIVELIGLDFTNTENVKYTCEAKIIEIDTSYGWWYKACYNCKAAIKICDDAFWCSRCGNNDQPPVPWYKLNAIVEDESGIANFTIFGRLVQDMVRIPAQNLAAAANSDQFTLPPIIKAIINQKHVFQVVPDVQTFRASIPSFKVLKMFTLNKEGKEKNQSREHLYAQSTGRLYSSTDTRQLHTELQGEITLTQATSSSSAQSSDKLYEDPPTKRLCLSPRDARGLPAEEQ